MTSSASPSSSSSPPSIKRITLQSLPIPQLPGWESRLVLLEFPPGFKVPPHTHPVAGACFVVRGAVVSRYEDQETAETFSAGQSFIDRADVLHVQADNASADSVLCVLCSYVVPNGQATTVFT